MIHYDDLIVHIPKFNPDKTIVIDLMYETEHLDKISEQDFMIGGFEIGELCRVDTLYKLDDWRLSHEEKNEIQDALKWTLQQISPNITLVNE